MSTATIIIAWVFTIFTILDVAFTPFLFGEERKPYSPQGWLARLILVNVPMLYLLYNVITL